MTELDLLEAAVSKLLRDVAARVNIELTHWDVHECRAHLPVQGYDSLQYQVFWIFAGDHGVMVQRADPAEVVAELRVQLTRRWGAWMKEDQSNA